MALVRNCYMIFPERLEKGQSPPTKSLKLSVWTLHKERHVGREKYTEQKGWGGKQDTGRARPKRHHTDSWMSYRRDKQHLLFWFSRTQGWHRLGTKSLCSQPLLWQLPILGQRKPSPARSDWIKCFSLPSILHSPFPPSHRRQTR